MKLEAVIFNKAKRNYLKTFMEFISPKKSDLREKRKPDMKTQQQE